MATRKSTRRKAPSAQAREIARRVNRLPHSAQVRLAAMTKAAESAPAERRLPSRTALDERADAAAYDAHRAIRMLRMLRQLADGDTLDAEDTVAIDGIGETLDIIAGIVDGIASQLDSVNLLAPDVRS